MTPEELKRLAEIAGYRFRDDTPEGQYCLSNTTDGWFLPPGEKDDTGRWSCVACQLDWQPHERIEHAMMVLTAFKHGAELICHSGSGGFTCNVWQSNKEYDYVSYSSDTPALAITHAALEALKEGK